MIASLRFLASRPVANLTETQNPGSGQLNAGRNRIDKEAEKVAQVGVRQASGTSAVCQSNHDSPAPLPSSHAASDSKPPTPRLGPCDPELAWVEFILIQLTYALAAVPWYFAVAGLAAHLAFVTAGGGK